MQKLGSYLAAASLAVIVLLASSLASARMPSFSEELGALAAGNAPDAGSSKPIDFALKNLDGNTVKLSHWRGHPVVVDFWATWCPPCRNEIPKLEKLYSKYHKSTGLVIVGIACDTVQGNGEKAVLPFVKEFSINYPILLANDDVLEQFNIMALPTTLFVAPDGKVVDRIRGEGPNGTLTDAVHRLLTLSGKLTPSTKQKAAHHGKWVTIDYTR